MSFYSILESLCLERNLKPQSKEIQEVSGVSSPAISGWKDKSVPKITPVIKLAKYFDVSTDYLLGLSKVRRVSDLALTEQEELLINAYRSANVQGQFNIITTCMNEQRTSKGVTAQAI